MMNKLQNLMKLQKQAKEIKDSLKNSNVEVEKAGGKIKISMNGEHSVKSISIDSSLLKEENKATLEKYLQECFNDASEKAQKMMIEKTKGSIDFSSFMK